MKNRLTLLLLSFISFNFLFSQEINNCKVDWKILESQETFDSEDNGKEFILNLNRVPKYIIESPTNLTHDQIEKELRSKINENKERNNSDPKIADSLKKHYTELYNNAGTVIFWWENLRPANETEKKELLKRIKLHDKKSKMGFIPANAYSNETTGYGKYWDDTIPRPEFIDNKTIICDGQIYIKKERKIRCDDPIFYQSYNASSLKNCAPVEKFYIPEKKQYNFPLGLKPLFDLTPFAKSTFVLKNESQGGTSRLWSSLNFVISDSIKISLMNYKTSQGQYLPSKDLSIDIFLEKSRVSNIHEYLTSVKNQNLVFIYEGEELLNPKIDDISYDFNSLTFKVTSNNKPYNLIFYGTFDQNFQYDEGWPDKRAQMIFNLPIYKSDCYLKEIEAFNNLKLNSDQFTDPQLKSELLSAIEKSPEWANYKIQRIILTNQSRWSIVTNKYTGLKESRFLLADVYVKSTKNDNCFLVKNVYFTQKADPIFGFVYSLFVAHPHDIKKYPCNLK